MGYATRKGTPPRAPRNLHPHKYRVDDAPLAQTQLASAPCPVQSVTRQYRVPTDDPYLSLFVALVRLMLSDATVKTLPSIPTQRAAAHKAHSVSLIRQREHADALAFLYNIFHGLQDWCDLCDLDFPSLHRAILRFGNLPPAGSPDARALLLKHCPDWAEEAQP